MPEEKCDHICTSNCRREGCNCECGEYHVDRFWGKSLAQIALEKKNMKYKLKREMPFRKVGEIATIYAYDEKTTNVEFEPLDLRGWRTESVPTKGFSDWFEEVDERQKPKPGEMYFTLDRDFTISDSCFNRYADEVLWDLGLVFRTYKLAEKAAEQIKALLKEFHKNNP